MRSTTNGLIVRSSTYEIGRRSITTWVLQLRDHLNQNLSRRVQCAVHWLAATRHGHARAVGHRSNCLRGDIRYFKWRNGVMGHATVLWSASVKPNSDGMLQLTTAAALL
jgi:hypothetical protein